MDTSKINKFENLVAFVLIVAICAFGCYQFLIRPKIREINSLNNSLRMIDSEIRSEQGGEMATKDVETARAMVQKQLADIAAKVPGEVDSPYLINNFIAVVGKGLNIDYDLIQPGEIVPEGKYKRLPLKVEFEGSYTNLNNYLAQLKNLPVTIRVDDMDLHQLGDVDKLSVRMDLSAFVMPGGTERPDIPIPPVSKANGNVFFKNPFAIKAVQPTKEVSQLKLEAKTPLKYTGYWIGKTVHAFVDDEVVKEGDVIEGYRVSKIYKDRVIVTKNKNSYIVPLVSNK